MVDTRDDEVDGYLRVGTLTKNGVHHFSKELIHRLSIVPHRQTSLGHSVGENLIATGQGLVPADKMLCLLACKAERFPPRLRGRSWLFG